jgi:hypothetical protein
MKTIVWYAHMEKIAHVPAAENEMSDDTVMEVSLPPIRTYFEPPRAEKDLGSHGWISTNGHTPNLFHGIW